MISSRKLRLPLLLFVIVFFSGSICAQPDKADSISRILGFQNDTNRVRLLLQLSAAYSAYAPRKGIQPASDARILSAQIGNDRLEALSLTTLGGVYHKSGNYDDAIDNYEQSQKIYSQLGLDDSVAHVSIMEGNVYIDKGNYDEALKQSFNSYSLYQKLGNKPGMASALIVSSNVYRAMHNYNKAVSDLDQALSISREIGDKKNEAGCLNNLSNLYGDKGDHDKAISYLEQAKEIYESLNDRFNIGKILNNIGTVYLEMSETDTSAGSSGLLDKAEDYFLQSLEIRKQVGDKRGMSLTLNNLAAVSADKGNNEKAVEYLTRAIEIAKNIGALDLEVDMLEALSECYEGIGDQKKALDFMKQYSAMKDSLFSENLSESVAEMQAKYGVEKAEGEALAQRQQNRIIVIFSIIGAVLLLAIVFILWNRAVTRKKVNVRLNQQKQEIEQKNQELHAANEEIELKNKDITDSITYASRIQEAILPEVEFVNTFGNTAFVFFRPKDIVSGDFYWMEQTSDHLLFAAVDCTGHGVPGAFVSIVCSNLLSQAVKEHGLTAPDDILNDVNIRLSETLRQRMDESRVRDGMDIALCSIDRRTMHMQYAGAFNPIWIFRGKEFFELNPDKFPVGNFMDEELKKFTRKEFSLQKGDRIYAFSDGYSDQFGGELGKKYKRTTFRDFIGGIQDKPIHMHRSLLEQEHLRWKGTIEQIDDILVLGIEI